MLLLTVCGCAAGAAVRYWVMTGVARCVGDTFPWDTLTVNTAGCFGLGLLYGGFGGVAPDGLSPTVFGVGFCGGLTTFSTFSLQTVSLVCRRRWGYVAANTAGALLLCLLCVTAGVWLGGRMAG